MADAESLRDPPIDEGVVWRRTVYVAQTHFRRAATTLSYFKSCHLAKCRRARRCEGCHPLEDLATTLYRQFPPCVPGPDRQGDLLRQFGLDVAQDMQAEEPSGLSPDEIERQTEAEEVRCQAELADDSLWPPALGGTARFDPLTGVSLTGDPHLAKGRATPARAATSATAATAPTRQPAPPASPARGRNRRSRRARSA